MATKKTIIKTDVTDWHDEFLQTEPDLSGDDPIIDLQLNDGMKPARVARMLIIGRLIGGVLKEDILPDNKLLLMTGGAVSVSRHTANQQREYEINGRKYNGRAYVAPVKEEVGVDEDDQLGGDDQRPCVETSAPLPDWLQERLVSAEDDKAYERAISYLLKSKVPGYIWNRFLVIAEHKPDELEGIADELKAKIDEMVERLS